MRRVAALALLALTACGYNLGEPAQRTECVAVCPQPVCPKPTCPQPVCPAQAECPFCPANVPVPRAAGGCDLEVACQWVRCDAPVRMCWETSDCCGDTPADECAVRCLPLFCGGVCAVPLSQ
jgi:hypothetical protein